MTAKRSSAVFVVDDSVTARHAIARALTCREERVIPIEVESLQELKDWCGAVTPDLVVLDLVLGEREDATMALGVLAACDPHPAVVLKTTTAHDDGAPRPCALPSMRAVRALAKARLDSRVEPWFLVGPESLQALRALVWEMLGR